SAQRVLRALEAPCGIFCVDGDSETEADRTEVFSKVPGVHYLLNKSEKVSVRGATFYVAGVARREPDVKKALAEVPEDAFTILLHHSPDVVLLLQDRKPDLVLAGHTHGGQVRIPGIGPIFTLTKLAPRYGAGLFREWGTTLYVNRGVGLEGRFAP